MASRATYYQAYEKLGAHLRVIDGVSGVVFAVWAPNARRVSVVGDFNRFPFGRFAVRESGTFPVHPRLPTQTSRAG